MKQFVSALLLFSIVVVTEAYEYGPPDGYVGNPTNCTECHSSFSLNSGSGILSLTGLPVGGYVPSQAYTLTVSLQQTGQRRWGFELSPTLLTSSTTRGGTMTITDATNTQLSSGNGTSPQYIKHTTTGTRLGTNNGPVTWSFSWTAPVTGTGTVAFHLAGNAANGDNTSSGDYIYTRSYTTSEVVNTVQPEMRTQPVNYRIVSAYPNPFNPVTTIRIAVPRAGFAKVAVYDLSGRLVEDLFSGEMTTQVKQFTFNGRTLPSGVYIVRISGNHYQSELKIVLLM